MKFGQTLSSAFAVYDLIAVARALRAVSTIQIIHYGIHRICAPLSSDPQTEAVTEPRHCTPYRCPDC